MSAPRKALPSVAQSRAERSKLRAAIPVPIASQISLYTPLGVPYCPFEPLHLTYQEIMDRYDNELADLQDPEVAASVIERKEFSRHGAIQEG